ncbi:MAG: hypothetical protein IIC26_08650, partial [Chloroflexi bacterium]|nr:hypothetical protein [Chloroflexota bacterium]
MEKIIEKFQALNIGEKFILISGAVLFIVGLLPWYSVDLGSLGSINRSGWQSPGAIWSILPILIGMAMAGVIAVKTFTDVELPNDVGGQSWARVYLAGGTIALLFVLIKLLNESSYMAYGFDLGIIEAGALGVAGFLMYREESG